MNSKRVKIELAILMMLSLQSINTFAQITNANKQQPDAVKLKKLSIKIEANPDDLKAHEEYIETLGEKNEILANQYAKWEVRFPKSAIVPFAIGKAYEGSDNMNSKEKLLKAVAINPKLAEAWMLLSRIASENNDDASAVFYMDKAVKAEPDNADYAFYHALLFNKGIAAKYDSLMLNVVYRFPGTDRGAEALCTLALTSFNKNEKPAYYDALYELYSDKLSERVIGGMIRYYDLLINTSPQKAFELALKMTLKTKINRQNWKQRISVARSFIEAQKMIDEGQGLAATRILAGVDLHSKIMSNAIEADESLLLLKTDALLASNRISEAYDSLSMFYSKYPTIKVRKEINNCAQKLSIDSSSIDSIIWRVRSANAGPKTAFSLENYLNRQQVSLSDFNGKVVLLTYWTPSCEPCRMEFPHFESALKKINNPNVVYLAIDLLNDQEKSILSIIKENQYSFVPLRDEQNKNARNFPTVRMLPTNFLFDQNGRMIFSGFQIDDDNESTLDLMITELLKMGNTK